MFSYHEINDGALLKFEAYEAGELVSSFTVNPYDAYLPAKLQQICDEAKATKEMRTKTIMEWVEFDESMAYLLSAALGGNQEGSLFRKYAPTEKLPTGEIFFTVIVKEVAAVVRGYIVARRDRWSKRSYCYKNK